MMTSEETIEAAKAFRALSEDERESIISKHLKSDSTEYLRYEFPSYARNFVIEMLENGRFDTFRGMGEYQASSFVYWYSLGTDSEFLFLLDELQPYLEIKMLHMSNNEPFEEFQKIAAHHFGDIGSAKFERTLYQYFVTYGQEDYEDEFGDYVINPFLTEPSDYEAISEDCLMAQTSIILSRAYGEDKVIPLLERINAGEPITSYELLKIVRSGGEVPTDVPLAWTAALV